MNKSSRSGVLSWIVQFVFVCSFAALMAFGARQVVAPGVESNTPPTHVHVLNGPQ